MINKEIIEEILAYDEFKAVPSYTENKENLEQIKKATFKLQRYRRYLEMRKLLAELGENESDIHIVSHAKSGTTLTQMILYQMTTEGEMNFEHLNDVSPWPGWALSFRLKIKETTTRRLFKSHDPYTFMNHIKKGKFIFLIRNVLDVMNSDYHHLKDYNELDKPYEDWALENLEYWYKYNEAWLRNESGLNILYLNYEDTIMEKEKQIEKIAEFINIELTEEMRRRILERTSFDFMKKHETKFGEQPNKKKVYDNFIRRGISGEGIEKATEEIKLKSEGLAEGFYKGHEVTKRYYE